MDEETAAVAIDFAPFAVRSMWGETALTRAELHMQKHHPDYYREICEYPEAYGYATEFEARGTEVGQYGWDTNYVLVPRVDEEVIESSNDPLDSEIAEALGEAWVENLVTVLSEAQGSTTLSAREFATLITMNNTSCQERRAADALGITIGTYRGKKGRIKEKREECTESSVLNRISKQHKSGYKSRKRQLGELNDREEVVKPTEILDTSIGAGKYSYWKQTREGPRERDHDTYAKPHWRTAHVEDVDRVFATDVSSMDDRDGVRLDLDGVGSGGADLHRKGENIQSSIWIGQPQATILFRQLAEALQESGTFENEVVSDDNEIVEWVRKHAIPGDRLQVIDPDTLDFEPVAQALLDG